MSVMVTTTIISSISVSSSGEIDASHTVAVDGPDDMPESLLRAVSESAARAILDR